MFIFEHHLPILFFPDVNIPGMSFELKTVVPWGRGFAEYVSMFGLTETELSQKIVSFGDGPASFNYEMSRRGAGVCSLDPIYCFSREQLSLRIAEVKEEVLSQVRKNKNLFAWKNIRNIRHLEKLRMDAMKLFMEDYEQGRADGRYICHSLPDRTPFGDNEFDLALSSHFLLLYDHLGLDFHLASVNEALRISRELRIFPIVNLDSAKTALLNGVLEHFRRKYDARIEKVNYEFQKGGNEMLVIKKTSR